MLSFLRLNNDDYADQFDLEQDRDLMVALDEATTPTEVNRVSTMARQRFAARARQTEHGRSHSDRLGLRRFPRRAA